MCIVCVCVCVSVVQGSSSSVVPLQLDASGKVKYDILARMGQRKDKVRPPHSYVTTLVCVLIHPATIECISLEDIFLMIADHRGTLIGVWVIVGAGGPLVAASHGVSRSSAQ